MGFLDTIKKLLSPEGAAPTGPTSANNSDYHLSSELRRHSRYFVLDSDLATLEITPSGVRGQIKDLSYGGMLAEFQDTWLKNSPLSDPNSIEAKLTFLDQSTPVIVQVVHEKNGGQTVGLSFVHRNIETLVFLREILENLRIGSTLHPLDPSHTKDKFIGEGKTAFRGEGPCDLQIIEKNGSIQNILLTFRSGASYFELRMHGDNFTTARSKDEDQKISTQMEPSAEGVDISILRNGIQLILGFLTTHPKSQMAQLLPKLYKQLYQK